MQHTTQPRQRTTTKPAQQLHHPRVTWWPGQSATDTIIIFEAYAKTN